MQAEIPSSIPLFLCPWATRFALRNTCTCLLFLSYYCPFTLIDSPLDPFLYDACVCPRSCTRTLSSFHISQMGTFPLYVLPTDVVMALLGTCVYELALWQAMNYLLVLRTFQHPSFFSTSLRSLNLRKGPASTMMFRMGHSPIAGQPQFSVPVTDS